MVKFQMYLSLIQIPILIGALLSGLYGTFITDEISITLLIILQGSIQLFGKIIKNTEEKARSMRIWDEEKEDEYQHVCTSWLKKPLPNF